MMNKSKNIIIVGLSAAMMLSLVGCSGPSKAASSKVEPAKNVTDEKKIEDQSKALDPLMVKGWPVGKIPAEIPEYTGGEIINSGGDAKEYYIKIKTTPEALSKYVESLATAGWNVQKDPKSPTAKKSNLYIEFTWYSDTQLQMLVRVSETGSKWPKDKVPPEIYPPEKSTFIGSIEIIDNGPDMWYFNYECDGIDEKAKDAYMNKLIADGWIGDTSMVSKDITWNGKKYSADVEVNKVEGNSTTFTCNFGYSN